MSADDVIVVGVFVFVCCVMWGCWRLVDEANPSPPKVGPPCELCGTRIGPTPIEAPEGGVVPGLCFTCVIRGYRPTGWNKAAKKAAKAAKKKAE